MNFNQLILERHSVRKFKPQPVSDVVLTQVLEAGRMAPSAVNYQPWIFIVVSDDAVLERVHKAYPREWFSKTKQIIVVCGKHDESWKRPHDGKDHCDIDIAIAADHMTLMATELGLGTCWVCHFDPKIVTEALLLPEEMEPVALLPIGYPDESSVASKKRKPLEEVVYYDTYK